MKYSDLIYEQYLLGELPPERMEELEAHIATDPEAEAYIAELRQSNEEILERYPKEMISPQIIRQKNLSQAPESSEKKPLSPLALLSRTALPVAAAITLLATGYLLIPRSEPIPVSVSSFPLEEGIRLKGETGLAIFRKGMEEIEVLRDEDNAREGDLLQITVTSEKKSYAAIISIDGRSTVTVHYPTESSEALPVNPGRMVLQKSYELDDAPGFERFFLITAKEKFPVEEILEKAEVFAADTKDAEKKALPLPKGFTQDSLLLKKR